jgi:hypothetical protein
LDEKKKMISKIDREKVERPHLQGLNFYLPKYDARIAKALEKAPKLDLRNKTSSAAIELFPSIQVEADTAYGYWIINVDGYRYLNCYLISDALLSSGQRGFSLQISFALEPTSIGYPAYGKTNYYFNMEEYYDTTSLEHKLITIETSDLLSATGDLPYIGRTNLVHMLRTPMMGPYVRARVLNRDIQPHFARVVAYATTT